jgi:hypothetical protein
MSQVMPMEMPMSMSAPVQAPALAPAEVAIDPGLMQMYMQQLSQAESMPLPEEDDFDVYPGGVTSGSALPLPPPPAAAPSLPPPARSGMAPRKRRTAAVRHKIALAYDDREEDEDDEMEEGGAVPKPQPPATIPLLSLSSIAKAQDFDGGFKGTEQNMKFLLQGSGKDNMPIPSALNTVNNISAEDKGTIWATIIALVVLAKKFGSNEERSAWDLLAEKAKEFVEGVLSDGGLAPAEVEKLVMGMRAEAENVV